MTRTGTIARFDATRGFGFLRCPQTSADVFFHVRDFDPRAGAPAVGQAVDFEEIHVGGKGPRAMAVRPAGHGAPPVPAARGHSGTPAQHQSPAQRAGSAGPTGSNGLGRRSRPSGPSASLGLFLLGLIAELALLAWGIGHGRLPLAVLAGWLVLNLATFYAYWHDKHAARRGAWRVAEQTLHLLSLAGGWPAAWWAQQLLRHKSRKPAFRTLYAATAVGHLLVLVAIAH